MVALFVDEGEGVLLSERDGVPVPLGVAVSVLVDDADGVRVREADAERDGVTHDGPTVSCCHT